MGGIDERAHEILIKNITHQEHPVAHLRQKLRRLLTLLRQQAAANQDRPLTLLLRAHRLGEGVEAKVEMVRGLRSKWNEVAVQGGPSRAYQPSQRGRPCYGSRCPPFAAVQRRHRHLAVLAPAILRDNGECQGKRRLIVLTRRTQRRAFGWSCRCHRAHVAFQATKAGRVVLRWLEAHAQEPRVFPRSASAAYWVAKTQERQRQ